MIFPFGGECTARKSGENANDARCEGTGCNRSRRGQGSGHRGALKFIDFDLAIRNVAQLHATLAKWILKFSKAEFHLENVRCEGLPELIRLFG